MALKVGVKAPEFSLFDTARNEVSLSGLAGKVVVLHFFPAAFSKTCTAQVCTSRDELASYSMPDLSVFGVSVDMPYALAAFKQQQGINFELLSDANKKMIHEYEMYHCNFSFGIKGVAKRGVVVIDKNGIIAYTEETENLGVQVDFEALKKKLEELK